MNYYNEGEAAIERDGLNGPITPYAGTSGWSGSAASEERARSRDANGKTATVQQRVAEMVERSGSQGRTIAEIRNWIPNEHHGTLSGALTVLHKGGKVLRLTTRRGKCSVYVAPQFLLGREAVPPKRLKQRDQELSDSVHRIDRFLAARGRMTHLVQRDAISSIWKPGSEEAVNLLVSDLKKVIEAIR